MAVIAPNGRREFAKVFLIQVHWKSALGRKPSLHSRVGPRGAVKNDRLVRTAPEGTYEPSRTPPRNEPDPAEAHHRPGAAEWGLSRGPGTKEPFKEAPSTLNTSVITRL